MKRPIAAVAAAAAFALSSTLTASANVSLRRVSADKYTNGTSQHKTEVEPDTFSSGSVEVSAFQSGRFTDGGASNIGWATTLNNGSTWTHGFLPGTTVYAHGPWARVSDPAVAFDPKHNVWLISSLAINSSVVGAAVLVSRSSTGTSWGRPVTVTDPGGGAFLDKEWISCDGNASSPHYGNCYTEWDDNGNLNLVYLSTSTDGGLTWSTPANTADMFHGIGGEPVAQPNGNVVVPIDNLDETALEAFLSTDGGATWTAPVVISALKDHAPGGPLRSGPLPSATVDSGGTVYVAWESCELEPNCASNDVLFSSSSTGAAWTPPMMVPIDGLNSGVDHLLPGLGLDHATSGSSAHLGIDYYAQSATCTTACALTVGFVSSANAGSTWTAATQMAGPMNPAWLADTTQGRMVGDYDSTSYLNGKAYPVFAVATAPTGSTFNESMHAPVTGIAAGAGDRAAIAQRSPAPAASTPARRALTSY